MSGTESQLYYLGALWPWAKNWTSLSPGSLAAVDWMVAPKRYVNILTPELVNVTLVGKNLCTYNEVKNLEMRRSS